MLSLPNDREREERWKEIENNVLAMDMKVYGVGSIFFYSASPTVSHATSGSSGLG